MALSTSPCPRHTFHLISSWTWLRILALSALVTTPTIADDAYPLRAQYPDVPLIELEALHAELNDVTVVDVRSAFEYSVLHISGALNAPVADHRFPLLVQELRQSTGKPLVLYCNGHTCEKSYKAGRLAQHAGLRDTKTYDGGIDDWAHAHPELTELLGKPLTSADRLISKEKLDQHMLSPDEFAKLVTHSVVVDIRTPLERAGLGLFVGRERAVELDNARRLDRMIDRAVEQHKPLLVYDNAGREVPWLQYYLEDRGITDYFFMKGGARAFFEYLQKGGG
ncbi:MAG: rhodanese-like domain-containing protein [Gammaproteobacteria bacterium]|nr:rhodanese-like domain-containing protein [Gammaproteobacteria bacterium]MCP5136347.1 rhodanese-like domain-containing protein [Gammaproteobacteria bacterium]